MNAPDRMIDWTEANQRVLVAEIERLKGTLSGDADPETAASAEARVEAARSLLPQPAALDQLADTFGLTGFERDVLLLCAGVEMDAGLAGLCGQFSGHPQRPWATFGIATAVLANPHWSAMAPQRPLRRWRLVEAEGGTGLTSTRLSIDERVVHFLAGLDYLDPRVDPIARTVVAPTLMARGHRALCDVIERRLAGAEPPLPVVQLHGPDRTAREEIAATCSSRIGLRLLAIDAASLPHDRAEVVAIAMLCEREAALGASALLVDCGDDPASPQASFFVERLRGVVFLSAGRAATLRRASDLHEVGFPDAAEQRRLWREALDATGFDDATAIATVASQFRFTASAIADVAATLSDADRSDDATPPSKRLWTACRRRSPGQLAELAQQIDTSAGWDDLILPDAQKQTLAQIAVHLRHRIAVYDEWGFGGKGSRGHGVSALFVGESGTGKTMAAEILAAELDLALFRIDLSSVVSKYIGETEKNLRRVFDAAEGTGAILLFDEADALFGKRSEVKDSHDRYANIEVSYLLQRMEAFRGLAILTTNHKSALDPAFMRRLRFVVHFPFPEVAERELIWRRAFPAAMPKRELAHDRLARLQVSGGHIHNIALAAAFLAAEAGEGVGMDQLLRAARAEAAKRERPLSDAEIRGWT